MCGIAGKAWWPSGPPVEVMGDLLAHRGPDGSGVWRHATHDISLAHRRLAIIDPRPESDQPFRKDGLVIVFNGEIYNYQALRVELAATGVTFRTDSDTEVLLEAWRRWDHRALTKLRGMFSFAIADEATGRVVLARDHFGIKPLFLCESGDGLAFASEQKALVPLLDDVTIDPHGVFASLLYYWVPEQFSTITGIRRLPAGHWAEKLPRQPLREQRWFDPTTDLQSDTAVSPDELRDIIEDSVQAHMIADVPVSTFLSGGLDSSLISILGRRHNADLTAYTIGFRPEDRKLEAMPDDLRYARRIAEEFDIQLNEIEIAPNISELLPKLVAHLDEPIGDAAAINTFLICQAAREQGRKVLLSGMGADELFGGYRKHYACLLAARYRRLPSSLRGVISSTTERLPVAVGSRGVRTTRWAKRFTGFADLDEQEAFRRSYTNFGREDLPGLLGEQLLPVVDEVLQQHADVYNTTNQDDPVNRMCMTDVQMFMVGLNLTYTDRASMAASTEVRVPFIDIDVARAAFSLSGADKIEGRERKAALKHASEGVVPRDVIYRPKGLFSAPLRAWMRRDLAEMIDDRLPDGALVRNGYVRRDRVLQLIAEDRRGSHDRSKELWQMLTLEEWMDSVASSLTPAAEAGTPDNDAPGKATTTP
jgi:asparagine synthase (glutamine-hydrolysing)